jgi:hypothetical protein
VLHDRAHAVQHTALDRSFEADYSRNAAHA